MDVIDEGSDIVNETVVALVLDFSYSTKRTNTTRFVFAQNDALQFFKNLGAPAPLGRKRFGFRCPNSDCFFVVKIKATLLVVLF